MSDHTTLQRSVVRHGAAQSTEHITHSTEHSVRHTTLRQTAPQETDCITALRRTANLRTKILDFIGFDSSRTLSLRGGILMPTGNSPEVLSQPILVGIILVGRLGVQYQRTAPWHATPVPPCFFLSDWPSLLAWLQGVANYIIL